MAFMKRDIRHGEFWFIDTRQGSFLVPLDVETDPDNLAMYRPELMSFDADDASDWTVERRIGWYGRLSAPGYLDCTDWTYADSEQELIAELREMYGDDDDDDDSDDDADDADGLDEMTDAYVETALWASTDDDGESLDQRFTADDIHPDTLAQMRADCADFLRGNADDIGEQYGRAGHDFWLTRNRHGAGFWDGDWPNDVGQRLTNASHPYGSYDLYVGDDGKLHGA